MPGVPVVLIDPLTGEPADEGEICLELSRAPVNLMTGYLDDPSRNEAAMSGGYYHTGDVASRDADGYITYIGRTDDVFKSSDYKVSPFELESVLIEHPAVVEAAVVPQPDDTRLAVPKAYVASPRDGRRTPKPQGRSWNTRAITWRPISRSAVSSSTSCPRRSRARFAASTCAAERMPHTPKARRIVDRVPVRGSAVVVS